jgi:uncharacterized integral membrane protein
MAGDPSLPEPAKERTPAEKRERARQAAGLVIAALGIAFAAVNLRNVKVDWIVGSGKSPLILVILVSVLIGAGIDRVAVTRARKRSKPGE